MSVRLRVLDQSLGLCGTCKAALIRKTRRGITTIHCGVHDGREVPDVVTECTKYLKYGEISVYEMQQIGWVLEHRKGAVIGFKKPDENDRRADLPNPLE